MRTRSVLNVTAQTAASFSKAPDFQLHTGSMTTSLWHRTALRIEEGGGVSTDTRCTNQILSVSLWGFFPPVLLSWKLKVDGQFGDRGGSGDGDIKSKNVHVRASTACRLFPLTSVSLVFFFFNAVWFFCCSLLPDVCHNALQGSALLQGGAVAVLT